MSFDKYIHDDDGAGDTYNHPRASLLGVDASTFSNSVQFQIPQFMLDGPPTLAVGGGAEVFPAGMFSDSGTMAASWLSNNGFSTKPFEER
jgi:hypothetical protein